MELPVVRRLKQKLEELRVELNTKLPKELEAARAHGDLSENAEYEAAKERQGYVAARIAQLSARIGELSMYSIESIPKGVVAYGSEVVVENVDDGSSLQFRIVFPEEVDVTTGRISMSSPIGRALANREVGDEVVVQTPRGQKAYEIVALRTLHERMEEEDGR